MKQTEVALCVSCDGTISQADMLLENVVALFRSHPWRIFSVIVWMLRGRATLQANLSSAVRSNWSALPLNQEVISLISHARSCGRTVHLVAAADNRWAFQLSEHLAVFDDVIASDEHRSREGTDKASILMSRFGQGGYDYIGSNKRDLPVWAGARKAIVVTNSKRLVQRIRALTELDSIIPAPKGTLTEYARMLRIHQWLKNLLVFVPGLAAHRIADFTVLFSSSIAFLAFGLCASSVYILNDLLDLENDRQHRTKYKRPLAAATVPISHGLLLVPALLALSFWIAAKLPVLFFDVLLGYFMITLLYSLWLKRQVIVDVMMLAGLYTMRVIAGATATDIQPSFWLLAFSIFLFLSLALVKRYAELGVSLREDKPRAAGRGYAIADLPVLLALGVGSGFVAVLIMALYINNPDLQLAYPSPIWLWFVPGLLLYWVSRMWMKTHRGEMHDDPVVFTARDWQSLSVVFLIAFCFLLAARSR